MNERGSWPAHREPCCPSPADSGRPRPISAALGLFVRLQPAPDTRPVLPCRSAALSGSGALRTPTFWPAALTSRPEPPGPPVRAARLLREDLMGQWVSCAIPSSCAAVLRLRSDASKPVRASLMGCVGLRIPCPSYVPIARPISRPLPRLSGPLWGASQSPPFWAPAGFRPGSGTHPESALASPVISLLEFSLWLPKSLCSFGTTLAGKHESDVSYRP